MRELRYNRWVERRKTEGPKTIAAVHADAQKELQIQRQQSGPSRGGGGGRGDRGGGGGGMGRRENLDQYGGPPRGQIGTCVCMRIQPYFVPQSWCSMRCRPVCRLVTACALGSDLTVYEFWSCTEERADRHARTAPRFSCMPADGCTSFGCGHKLL